MSNKKDYKKFWDSLKSIDSALAIDLLKKYAVEAPEVDNDSPFIETIYGPQRCDVSLSGLLYFIEADGAKVLGGETKHKGNIVLFCKESGNTIILPRVTLPEEAVTTIQPVTEASKTWWPHMTATKNPDGSLALRNQIAIVKEMAGTEIISLWGR